MKTSFLGRRNFLVHFRQKKHFLYFNTHGLSSSPLYSSLSWPSLAEHKLHVTPPCFSLCTSTAPSPFPVTEHSRNLSKRWLHCIILIILWPDFFCLNSSLDSTMWGIYALLISVSIHNLAYSLVHMNTYLFSDYFTNVHCMFIYLYKVLLDKGVDQRTWFPSPWSQSSITDKHLHKYVVVTHAKGCEREAQDTVTKTNGRT